MALKITTDGKPVMVFRQDKTSSNGNAYTTYAVGVSSKDMNDEWVNGFIDCKFKKGVDIANKTKININNAFYTCRKVGERVFISIMVTDYEVAEEGQSSAPTVNNDFMNIPDGFDEELPFV